MGIKQLTAIIKKEAPNSISHINLHKISGKKVAVDASLIIYQNLLNIGNRPLFRNKDNKITNHVTGIFYKIINYIALDIELIFVFDGKAPEGKRACINDRNDKASKNKELMNKSNNIQDKIKHEKLSLRLTDEFINDIKKLLNLMGIAYIHPDGEAEAYASELCRTGYVDYVLTEDMDTMAYGCPKLIRNCLDKSLKRSDIISIIDYDEIIKGLNLSRNQFLDFCILSGCDYCPSISKLGNITALKLIKKYKNIDEIIKHEQKYNFKLDTENYDKYLNMVKTSRDIFNIYYNNIDKNDIVVFKSIMDIDKLKDYLINEIEMNEKKVTNALKKLNNIYSIN